MSRVAEASFGRRPGVRRWWQLGAAARAVSGLVWGRAGSGADAGGARGARRVVVVHSDIVASTQLLEVAGPHYPRLLVRHRSLIAAAVERWGGHFLSHAGDGTLAVFGRADHALQAAVEAQRALADEPWADGLAPRVRMGVHAGDVYDIDGEPVGLVINHGARIMAAGRPGQVMVSGSAAEEAMHRTTPGAGGFGLADAGWHVLRDHAEPVRLRQVVADGLTVVAPGGDDTVDLTIGAPRLLPLQRTHNGAA